MEECFLMDLLACMDDEQSFQDSDKNMYVETERKKKLSKINNTNAAYEMQSPHM